MNDEYGQADTAPENPAVAAALSKLDGLESAPLEEHAAIFEAVRGDLKSALDAD